MGEWERKLAEETGVHPYRVLWWAQEPSVRCQLCEQFHLGIRKGVTSPQRVV